MGFFDDLTKKASETYKNTAEKTNKITREMRLKSMMNDYKNATEKVYAEIGKKVYEKHVREENIDIKAELAEECSKIDAYAKEIEDIRMEMLTLKDLRICKTCASEIPLSAKFCPKCGAKQEEINNKPEEKATVVEAIPDNTKTVTEETPVEAPVETPVVEQPAPVEPVENQEVNNEVVSEENTDNNQPQ